MEFSALVIFAGALLIAAGSPGPSIAALVARVLTGGWRDVMPFLIAMWVGEGIWLTLAVYGLAALAAQLHWAFLTVKYVGVAYLLYLACKMWGAPVEIDSGNETPVKGSGWQMFMTGFAVTMGNPKIMMFYLALLPTLINLNRVTVVAWAELALTMLVVLAAIDVAYVVLAARARIFIRSPRALKLANRISAGIMGGAAAAIASRN